MDESLLSYYERELTFIRELGAEFAKKYPKIAGRLLLEPDKCEDPHTERLIEGFSFLAARIHKKIDDDFPEITQSLLNVICPHYLRPIPSMSIVQFDPVKQNIPASGYAIDRGCALYSKPIGGVPCQFRTCYPVMIHPLEVVSAELRDPQKPVAGAQLAIVLRLKTYPGLKLSQLECPSLRFFLNGPGQHIYHLHELILNHVCHIECETPLEQGLKESFALTPEALRAVGFEPDQIMLPYARRSLPGYLLLFEYFCFPEKFLYFELSGLDRLRRGRGQDTLDLWLYLNTQSKPGLVLHQDMFCLNTAPAVNLFQRIAEPIRMTQRQTEYRVVPDVRRRQATEVYSIDRVSAAAAADPDQVTLFQPFYSLKHRFGEAEGDRHLAFWHGRRAPSGKKGDAGTEVDLSFVDLNFQPAEPRVEILTVQLTCTNRDLPARLPFADPGGDFDLEIAAPVSSVRCLTKPTRPRRPALGGALQWRLISHLALNYLTLVSEGEDAFRELLGLYDFENSPATRQQIAGIVRIQSEYVSRRIERSFCRGLRVNLTLDEDKFVGAGPYLFASVLEHFLGHYVSVNSFCQLVARTLQRKEPLKAWPPRTGNRILI